MSSAIYTYLRWGAGNLRVCWKAWNPCTSAAVCSYRSHRCFDLILLPASKRHEGRVRSQVLVAYWIGRPLMATARSPPATNRSLGDLLSSDSDCPGPTPSKKWPVLKARFGARERTAWQFFVQEIWKTYLQ